MVISKILNFWFSDEVKPKWFAKDESFDQKIIKEFLPIYKELEAISVSDLVKNKNIEEILALVILFDQFPRNMFRNDKQSFATDKKAIDLAKFAISKSYDQNLSEERLKFLYMPFMHSEKLEEQEYSIKLFSKLDKFTLDYAIQHRDIIKKFNRFPHRNAIMGRKSTKEELEFLQQPNSSF